MNIADLQSKLAAFAASNPRAHYRVDRNDFDEFEGNFDCAAIERSMSRGEIVLVVSMKMDWVCLHVQKGRVVDAWRSHPGGWLAELIGIEARSVFAHLPEIVRDTSRPSVPRVVVQVQAGPASSSLNRAATTGDLAAAISQGGGS